MTGKEKLRNLLVCLALAIGTALLYSPVLRFEFINYDDNLYIVNNYYIRHFSWQSLAWCFQTTYSNLWHPLTWMSHALDFVMFGTWAGGHHATSVVLHALNSVLLFIILRRMTAAFWRSAIVAALFAWHPLHVESVAWVAERKDVLSTFFWMLTVWAYVGYVENFKIQNSKFKIFYAFSLLFFACGLMAKPMLVTLPFVLILFDWWPLRRMRISPPVLNVNPNINLNPKKSHSSTESRPTFLRLFLEKLPFLVMAAIACLVTLRIVSGGVVSLEQMPLSVRVDNALVSCIRYVDKIIWPRNLVIIYPYDFRDLGREALPALVCLGIVSWVALRCWKTRPYWLAGWLFFLGVLVPVLGLVQAGVQPIADRYTYLSFVGISIMLCWGLCDLVSGWRSGRAILAALAVAALGACLFLSHKQLAYWKTSKTLFLHNIEVTPDNPIPHANYAAFLCEDRDLKEAADECVVTLKLSPNDAQTHHTLGKVFYLQGKFDQAIPELYTALRLNPNNYLVHLILGNIALLRHSPAEAASQASIAMAADPANPEAHCILGQALGGQGKLDEGCAQLTEALRLAPQYPEAQHQLAVLLAMQHQTGAAISHYRAALALQSDRLDTLNNLAWLLATDSRPENRDGAEAVRLASRACDLTRRQEPFFIGTLAAAYAEAGRFDEAVATAQQAHDLAEAKGMKDIAARNLELLALYRSRLPYHEK